MERKISGILFDGIHSLWSVFQLNKPLVEHNPHHNIKQFKRSGYFSTTVSIYICIR